MGLWVFSTLHVCTHALGGCVLCKRKIKGELLAQGTSLCLCLFPQDGCLAPTAAVDMK